MSGEPGHGLPAGVSRPSPLVLMVGVMLAMLVGAVQVWAGISCSARLDRQTAKVGEQVVLTLEVEGDVQSIETPRLPDFGPFEVYGGGESQRLSLVNGTFHSSHSYTWYLRPLKAGSFELPPIEVAAGGQVCHTGKLSLTVRSGGQAPPAASGGAGGGASPSSPSLGSGGTRPSTGGSGGPATALDVARPGAMSQAGRAGDPFLVTMSVDRDTVVVGEQIVLTFSFFRGIRTSIFSRPQYTPPSTEGFWREDLPPERHDTVDVKGEPYEVTRIQYALFPTRAGKLQVGEAMVRIPQDAFDSFFRRSPRRGDIVLRAPAIPVLVRELPPGRPEDFSGTVASGLHLKIETDRNSLKVGDALTVTLELSGQGYLASAGKPRLPSLEDFREHDSGSSLDSRPVSGRLQGRLRVESLLIPRKAGDFEIPPVHYSYYDTDQHRYRTLSTDPVPIHVTASGEGEVQSFATGGKSRIEVLSQDILHIQPITARLRPYHGLLLRSRVFWAAVALPLLLWLVSGLLARRRRLRLADPVRLRAEAALRHARRRLAEEGDAAQRAGEALMVWLGDKSNRAPAGLTRDDMERWLQTKGVGEAMRREVADLLDRVDRARFATATSGEDLPAVAEDLLKRLEKEVGRD